MLAGTQPAIQSNPACNHGIKGWTAGTAIDSEETMQFAKLVGVETMTQTYKFPEEVQAGYDAMDTNKARLRSVLVMKK